MQFELCWFPLPWFFFKLGFPGLRMKTAGVTWSRTSFAFLAPSFYRANGCRVELELRRLQLLPAAGGHGEVPVRVRQPKGTGDEPAAWPEWWAMAFFGRAGENRKATVGGFHSVYLANAKRGQTQTFKGQGIPKKAPKSLLSLCDIVWWPILFSFLFLLFLKKKKKKKWSSRADVSKFDALNKPSPGRGRCDVLQFGPKGATACFKQQLHVSKGSSLGCSKGQRVQ